MKITYNNTKNYAPTVKKTGKRQPNERLVNNQKFYSSRKWRKARSEWIKLEPLCVHCLEEGKHTPGDVVDHKVPVSVDPTLSLDGDNLQTLCHAHHNKKTEEDKKKYPHVYSDFDRYYKDK